MKRMFLFLILFVLVSLPCLGEDEDFYFVHYDLSPAGEAIIDDVSFYDGWDTQDANRVYYEIFVGSFSDSDGDGTGDLRGIINRMDYLNDGDPQSGLSLGVEGLWLTPIFRSSSYHKYDVDDFYAVDPAFGTLEDLKELIQICHERNVKLILDLPINHTGTGNRWFKNFINAHLMQNPDNDYYNFYVWRDVDDALPTGRYFARSFQAKLLYEANFSDSMPELDFDQPFVRQTLLDVARYYLELGVDGFRFDAAKYVYFGDNAASADFWDWYIGELKQINPDLYTVAEVWDGDGIIDQYIPFTNCFNFSSSQTSGIIAETAKAGDANRYAAYLAQYQRRIQELRDGAACVLFISNHDMDRAAGYLTAASGQMYVAANLYLLSPGTPFIYYGEEMGLKGSRGGANTDANRRLAMRWGDGDTVADPPGTTYDPAKQTSSTVQIQYPVGDSLYNYYKRLIMVRKANPEIARGEYTALTVPDSKVGGFLCEWEGSTIAVFHNTTQRDITIDLAQVTDIPFSSVSAFIGMGRAFLNGTKLTLEGQTSVVLR